MKINTLLGNLDHPARLQQAQESTSQRIIRAVDGAGVKPNLLAAKAEVSLYRLKSVVWPDIYKGNPTFDKYELQRINKALDEIANQII